jgi:hypothetical protein
VTVGSQKARLKIEMAKQIVSRVRKRDGGRPSNKFRGIRECRWREELNGPEFHNLVERAGKVAVLLRPSTALGVAKPLVRGVLDEEVNVVYARGTAVGTIRIGSGQKQID